MATEHFSEPVKQLGDAVSIFTVIATLAKWLPAVAALFTIVWTIIRIYETDTVRSLLGKKKKNGKKD